MFTVNYRHHKSTASVPGRRGGRMRLPKTIWRQLQQYWLWTREVEPMLMNLHPDEIQRCISLAEMPHGMWWLKPLTVQASSRHGS